MESCEDLGARQNRWRGRGMIAMKSIIPASCGHPSGGQWAPSPWILGKMAWAAPGSGDLSKLALGSGHGFLRTAGIEIQLKPTGYPWVTFVSATPPAFPKAPLSDPLGGSWSGP